MSNERAKYLSELGKLLTYKVRELGSIPKGHLYASVMSLMSKREFDCLLTCMKSTGFVKDSNHVLTWTGP